MLKAAVILAAVVATGSFAADVNVIGANTVADLMSAPVPSPIAEPRAGINVIGAQTPSLSTTATKAKGMGIDIASKDLLNRPTALINKNTLVSDNNIFISRSNLVFTQSDRMAMRKRVHEALEAHAGSGTAILTKSVLRAVSAPSSDQTIQTKASAVVAASGAGDSSALMKSIADFVDTAAKREVDREQAMQSKTPRGIIVLVGTRDTLRQPSAIVNKNIVLSDNQVSVARSVLSPSQNDRVSVSGDAKVADAILPASSVDIGDLKVKSKSKTTAMRKAKKTAKAMKAKGKRSDDSDSDDGGDDAPGENYRVAFMYPKNPETIDKSTDKNKEFWGGCGGLGWGCGWRYPLPYWNSCGAALYGGGCGLGFPFGGYFYC